jgi:Family of unknown function (DUF5681)
MQKIRRKNRHSVESHEDNEVGYCRPPKHAQFRPGQSGNPKGRPKGRMNVGTLVQVLLNQKVTVREGDKVKRMSKLEAIIQSMIARALNGDAKANEMILALANEYLPAEPQTVQKIQVDFVHTKADYSKQIVRT